MKKHLPILFFLFFSFATNAQKEYIEYYENGVIKLKSQVLNNLLDGAYFEYYKSGNIKTKGFYSNCDYKLNHVNISKITCYVGEHLKNKEIHKGKRHNLWTQYYESGNIEFEQNYYCGFKQGTERFYNEKGLLEFQSQYDKDELISESEYFDNEALKSHITYEFEDFEFEDYYERLKNITEITYNKTGNILIKRFIKEIYNIETEKIEEQEVLIKYYENGFIKTYSVLIDDFINGEHRTFYKNGNMNHEGIYKDDKPIDKQYYYNKDGSIERIETWENGKLVEIKKS